MIQLFPRLPAKGMKKQSGYSVQLRTLSTPGDVSTAANRARPEVSSRFYSLQAWQRSACAATRTFRFRIVAAVAGDLGSATRYVSLVFLLLFPVDSLFLGIRCFSAPRLSLQATRARLINAVKKLP